SGHCPHGVQQRTASAHAHAGASRPHGPADSGRERNPHPRDPVSTTASTWSTHTCRTI
ncbi:unnamed protein product, partial [Candidula unifasciata]